MTLNPTITRRSFLQRTALVAAGPLLAACAAGRGTAAAAAKEYLLYIGTYGPMEQDNVFLYRLHPGTGAFTKVAGFRGGVKPGFLTLSADHRFLYATLEVEGSGSGAVRAFGIDQGSGALTVLNEQPSAGAGPCYVSLTPGDKAVLVANYGGGTISALPVQAGGLLAPAAVVDQHQGSGPHPNQKTAHAHCILPDPQGRYALSADLGNDQVLSYALNPTTGLPQLPGKTAFRGQPGAGPRHLAFHPNGRWAYVINELNSTVTALSYDAAQGIFTELHTVPALPAGFTGTSYSADIHVSPDGRFVYASNRGHDSIVVLAVDRGSGRLSVVQHASTQGKFPRNFTISPDGRLVLVANQHSNNIFSYHVDPKTGQLTPTGFSTELPAPVCLRLVPDFTTS